MFIKQNKYSTHSYYMKLALLQARQNLGNTKKNPAVGCIVVKNRSIIGAGSTSFDGRPHAEINAISFSKRNISNSDLYVTLEPCSHFGKTHPCVNKIIKRKIKRVFFSIKDPDIRSYNKSSKIFKKNKIIVKKGILSSEVKNFYKSYLKYKKDVLPFVTAKIAISKDYFINDRRKKWITNEFSRGRNHFLRSNHDCILTSSKTVLDDNPHMTCRIEGFYNRSPSRFILDSNLSIPISSNILKSTTKFHTVIFFNKLKKNKIKKLKHLRVKLVRAQVTSNGDFDLRKILIKVKSLGYSRILIESGLKLTTNFLNHNLVDEFQLFTSSKKLGSNGYNSFRKNMKLLSQIGKKIDVKVNLFNDKLISYRIK